MRILRKITDDDESPAETYPLSHVVIVHDDPTPPRRLWMMPDPFDWAEGE